ncbi:hypothetical protein [Demequina sp. NBRC 110052]|uniref:hypothetical protein n=1 Tax=Demequina sp. NBRC 110052 TaxID=1570341 RepID=UPI001F387274|nr:hypothetical protein [Demequina sp. NBRC 110052]
MSTPDEAVGSRRHVQPIARIALIATYAILCLAATGRSAYQISTKLSEAPVPYLLSAVSALLYGVIAYAMYKGMRRLAIVGSAIELVGVLTVGALGYLESSWWPDETVWTGFGSAYGWVPLLLPIAALIALARAKASTTAAPEPASGGPEVTRADDGD